MPVYYIVLDLEMNPTAEVVHRLKMETIEIGAVKIDAATNQVMEHFSCVICPELNYRIEPKITRLTGITTNEVQSASTFKAVLQQFVDWVGDEPSRFYSWSINDLSQIRKECFAKGIAFPDIFNDWVDFQAEYPKYLGYSHNRCFRLAEAAELIGVTVIDGCAHRALYDAQITAELILFVLTEEYKNYSSKISHVMVCEKEAMTYSIGDTCGGKLAALLARLNHEKEREGYGKDYIRAAAAFVR